MVVKRFYITCRKKETTLNRIFFQFLSGFTLVLLLSACGGVTTTTSKVHVGENRYFLTEEDEMTLESIDVEDFDVDYSVISGNLVGYYTVHHVSEEIYKTKYTRKTNPDLFGIVMLPMMILFDNRPFEHAFGGTSTSYSGEITGPAEKTGIISPHQGRTFKGEIIEVDVDIYDTHETYQVEPDNGDFYLDIGDQIQKSMLRQRSRVRGKVTFSRNGISVTKKFSLKRKGNSYSM